MKKTTIIIMLLTVLAKIIGFAREIVLSYFYGASGITDAYLISLTIPSTIFAFIGTALVTSYIPIFNEIKVKHSEDRAVYFTSNIINIIMLLSLFLTIVIFLFAEPVVKIFASGFTGETLKSAVLFTKIGILSISFSALIFIFNGYLQINDRFYPTVIAGIPASIFVILSIGLSYKLGSVYLSIGSSISILLQLLFLIPYIKKTKFKWKKVFKIGDEYLVSMLKLSLPVIIGDSVNQINVLVDRSIASNIAIGGISAISYANRLNLFIQGIFVMSIATVFYPTISKMIAIGAIGKLKKTFSMSINVILLMLLPASIGSMVFSNEIVLLIFGRGAFDEGALKMTSVSLFFYSVGMIGFGLREIISRVFYASQDTKTPMINASIGMIINIVLNLVLSRFLGIGGLALATSISGIIISVLLFISLRKKIGPFGIKKLGISFIKIIFASLIMAGLAKIIFIYLTSSLSQNFSLILSIGIGAISYFVFIYFMKIEEVDEIVGVIKNKFGISAA